MNKHKDSVLYIDDENMMCLIVGDYLEDCGYCVYEAQNGQDGLRMFREKQPDVVIVDLRMPDIDGLDILATITKESPETPVIVISGIGSMKDVIKALRLGASDYITKPVEDMGFLEHAIQKSLKRAQLTRENREYKENLERLVYQRTEELRKSEERLTLALEATNDGIWEFNPQTGAAYYSPRWFTMLGYEPDEFPQHNDSFLQLLHPEDKHIVETLLQKHITEKTDYHAEFRIKAKDGEWRWIYSRGKVVEQDQHGKPLRMIGIHTDITERKRAEEEIKQLNEELEQRVMARTAELQESLETLTKAQKHLMQTEKMVALGSLVAGITHEINTPVGIGVTAASHLEHKTSELHTLYTTGNMKRSELESYLNTAQESAGIILSNLDRAAKLIKGFKQMAVDQSTEDQRRFKFKAYIEDILLSLRPELKRTKHQITINCPEDLKINSYPGAISQIITNLVMNSLLHGFEAKEHGEITIDVSSAHETLHLTYHDNGKGIPPEHLSKIFTPFFTTKKDQYGSGLGMYIVYNIITQQLGGTIECQSTLGEGTTFSIEMPLNPPNA